MQHHLGLNIRGRGCHRLLALLNNKLSILSTALQYILAHQAIIVYGDKGECSYKLLRRNIFDLLSLITVVANSQRLTTAVQDVSVGILHLCFPNSVHISTLALHLVISFWICTLIILQYLLKLQKLMYQTG